MLSGQSLVLPGTAPGDKALPHQLSPVLARVLPSASMDELGFFCPVSKAGNLFS